MKRVVLFVSIMGVFAVSAFGQGPRALAGSATAAERPQAQIQQQIADLYLANFKAQVGLDDDQFLVVRPLVLRFINQRFDNANKRKVLEDRQAQLLSQADPSETEIQTLNEDLSKLDDGGAIDKRFLNNLQTRLPPRQSLVAREFHKSFINETLPMVLERLRAAQANAPKGQQQRPADARPNQQQNRNQQRQDANTLRGKNPQPAPPARKNPAR
jgi:hypothetical protein